ncbi:MAG: hypothetical protein RR052_06785, partial [Oscillospiraceae bacterium]
LGGMGSFTGSIVSAITLTILPEALRSFSQYRMLIYSLALILMMIFKPSGLLGTYEFSLTRFWGKLTGKIPREVKIKKENGKIVSFLIKIKEKILASKKVKTDVKTQNDNGDNLEQGDKK